MEYWLPTSPWAGVILWIILYISDYYLTIHSARGFREIGHFQFEGSYELTPQFQKDVDAFKPISSRHLAMLVLCSLIIFLLWWAIADRLALPWLYNLYLGLFLLVEVAVHLRHLRNVFLVHEVRRNGGVEGQISYRKWFSYRVSAFEFYLIGTLFLIVAILAFSSFFLGGALACYGTGLKHCRLAKKTRSLAAAQGS
ncbi:MAG TPA: hypothetical protein VFR47_18960 [Anaerolineales bacterium]|nr:hypothetical protein [Anaerolineales bacterium]